MQQIIKLDNLGDDLQCTGTTKAGRQCKNPIVFSQAWYSDGTVFRDHYNLTQQRCHKHVDKTGPLPDVCVVFGDDDYDEHHDTETLDVPAPETWIQVAVRTRISPTFFAQILTDMSLALQSPVRRDRDELVDEIVSLNDLPDSSHTIEALRFLVTNGYVSDTELGYVSVEPFSTRLRLIQGGLSERLSNVA